MSGSKLPPDRVARHIARLPRSGIRDFFEVVSARDDVVSLGIGEPDFAAPWRIREATIDALDRGFTSYTSNLGLLSLRQEICRHVGHEFGVQYDPGAECIVTVGVSEAFDLAIRAVTNPGDEVVYHEPCYVSYAPTIAMAHAVPVPVRTRETLRFALDPDELEAAITPKTRLVVLNFPCNPTGATLTLEQKQRLAETAVRNDVLVISDAIYADLIYGERTPSLLSMPGMRERTLLLHGFSKSYAMTGYRIAYACGPADLIEAMMKIHQYSMLCASSLGQAAALSALREGHQDMLAMKREFEQRRNVIVKRLNDMGLPCHLPEGAFYVFSRIADTGLTSDQFARQLLDRYSVAVVPGTAFGPSGEGFVRCSYATGMDDIEVAMTRMRDFVREL